MTVTKKIKGGHEPWIIAVIILLSILLWVHGLQTSQILDAERQAQKLKAALLTMSRNGCANVTTHCEPEHGISER